MFLWQWLRMFWFAKSAFRAICSTRRTTIGSEERLPSNSTGAMPTGSTSICSLTSHTPRTWEHWIGFIGTDTRRRRQSWTLRSVIFGPLSCLEGTMDVQFQNLMSVGQDQANVALRWSNLAIRWELHFKLKRPMRETLLTASNAKSMKVKRTKRCTMNIWSSTVVWRMVVCLRSCFQWKISV